MRKVKKERLYIIHRLVHAKSVDPANIIINRWVSFVMYIYMQKIVDCCNKLNSLPQLALQDILPYKYT